jgi:hypothetical protein
MQCPTGARNSHQSGRPPTRLNLWVHALKQLRPRPHWFALHPFCTRIFCPTGKSVKTCPAPLKKIFRFPRRANQRYQLAPSFPGKRGGRASSRTREGMRWTLWRRRVCVRRAVFRERTTARRRTALSAYGKTVWSRHPLLVSSCRWRDRSDRIRFRHQAGSDGDKTNSSPGRARHKP